MILEILAIYALIQCTALFARLIGRRGDVLRYVDRTQAN